MGNNQVTTTLEEKELNDSKIEINQMKNLNFDDLLY